MIGLGWALLLVAAWKAASAQLMAIRIVSPRRVAVAAPPPSAALAKLRTLYAPRSAQAHQVVRIALLAGQHFQGATVLSEAPLLVGRRAYEGRLTLRADRGRVVLSAKGRRNQSLTRVVVRTRGDRPLQIRGVGAQMKVTVGVLEFRARGNRLEVIDTIDFERYVMGVVEPELGSLTVKPDVIKAQLIASRSYLMSMRGRHRKDGFDFCDAPHCQVFSGLVLHHPVLEAAAKEVRGIYLEYKGRPAVAFFHHSCGGRTAAVEDVWPTGKSGYLRSIVDGQPHAYCDHRGSRASWTTRLSIDSIRSALVAEKVIGRRDTLTAVRVSQLDASGRARTLHLAGAPARLIPARRFVNAVNRHLDREVIYSLGFKVRMEGRQAVIEGRGWGHGVGLCQEGAIEMARQGKTYRQILQHYYPGTTISRMPE